MFLRNNAHQPIKVGKDKSLHLSNQTFSIENSAIFLKEQLERDKDAIGERTFFIGQSGSTNRGKSPQLAGRNMPLSTQ